MDREDDATRRSQRIALRVDPAVDELLRLAAASEHKTLSAFVLDAAYERARAVFDEQRRLELAALEFARVADELDQPAEVVAPLLLLAEQASRAVAAAQAG